MTAENFTLEQALYRDAEGNVVREGDPSAAFIYRGAGAVISLKEAEELGLVEKPKPKKADKPADKKRESAKNKSAK